MEEKTGVRLEDSKLEELPVEEINNVVLQQQQEQVQQQVQQSTSNIDIGSVVDGVTDYLVIDSIVDGVAAIGEGLVAIIGSMFD